jgi:hypothetical protein
MERKRFLNSLALIGAGGTVLTSCLSSESKTETINTYAGFSSGFIFHSVYFWLKEGVSSDEEKDFLKFFEILKKVPGVESCHIGKPAKTNPRPVVDNSFSYHIMLTFASLEAITKYEEHPDHLAGIDQYSKLWVKVEVKDTVIS